MSRSENRSLSFWRRRSVGTLATALTILVLVGCDIPERPPLRPESLDELQARSGGNAVEGDGASVAEPSFADSANYLEPPSIIANQAWETWDAYYVGDQHVGYNHVVAKPVENDSSGKMSYLMDNLLLVNQGQARTVQHLQQTSTEDKNGRLIDFESSLQVGPVVTNYSGEVVEDAGDSGKEMRVRVKTRKGRNETSAFLAWDSTYRGLVAIEQSLRQKPLTKKGDIRFLKMLVPGNYKIGTAKLKCSGPASVPMQDGTMLPMTEISCEIQLDDGSNTYSTIWIDDEGAIRRTYSPGIKLVAYRTNKQSATDFVEPSNISVLLPIEGEIDRPLDAKRIAFEVTPVQQIKKTAEGEESEELIKMVPEPGQWVRKTKSNQFQLLVSRKQETNLKSFEGSDLKPSDADLSVNSYVDFRNGLVRRFASAAVASRSELSRREVALELTRTANSLIEVEPDKIGLMRASVVAQEGKASQTGRAILLMAMLRAKDIPARLAIGLRYQQGSPSRMVYHSWVLAFVDDQWIHLDVDDGDMGACDRIILTTSALDESSQNKVFVPFMDAVSRIRVRVVNAAY
ncbi:transglutaminase-like domain-containing protein [Rubripirellula amarantea]|nr:transglutaminase-like domain-containing protein [Rubripirellula amarantea]